MLSLEHDQLLETAIEARRARLVDASFLRGLSKLIAINRSQKLPEFNAPPLEPLAQPLSLDERIRSAMRELDAQLELSPRRDRGAEQADRAPMQRWGSPLGDMSKPIHGLQELVTAATAFAMLIAELRQSYSLKLDDALYGDELLVAIMAALETSFIGASSEQRLTACRWLRFRANDMGWSVSLQQEEDGTLRAASNSAGLDGYGRDVLSNLRQFCSPAQLVAYKAFAGYGSVRARALQTIRLPLCSHLRSCIGLVLNSARAGCSPGLP